MRKPKPPAEVDRRLGMKALERFESEWLGHQFEPQLRAGFLHGWRLGSKGQTLESVLRRLDGSHPDAGAIAEAVSYGHATGEATFLRIDPDYEELRTAIANGTIASMLS